ncbi:hypothetical protein BDZ89DRAFT_493541 [Hymenopellis radicata]|nr:hypothetical protein BDZ89DRAFT_493541 [Hymenopellis radicata]
MPSPHLGVHHEEDKETFTSGTFTGGPLNNKGSSVSRCILILAAFRMCTSTASFASALSHPPSPCLCVARTALQQWRNLLRRNIRFKISQSKVVFDSLCKSYGESDSTRSTSMYTFTSITAGTNRPILDANLRSSRSPFPAEPTQPLIPDSGSRTSSASLRIPITHLEGDPNFPYGEIFPAPEPGWRGRGQYTAILITEPFAQTESDNIPELIQTELGEASRSPRTSRRSSLREPSISEGVQSLLDCPVRAQRYLPCQFPSFPLPSKTD